MLFCSVLVLFVQLSSVRQCEIDSNDSCLVALQLLLLLFFFYLLLQEPLIHSVLWAKGTVVGAVAALFAEVDVGPDAALQQRLGGPGVVAYTHEDLVGFILAEEAQGVHLHLRHVDRLVDEYPRGRLVAGRGGNGALVGDIARGVGVEVCYVQAHQ